MIITGIEEITKSRSKVFIDGEFAFVLYTGELRRFHLQEGGELGGRDYEKIMGEILPKRAKLRAMNLLMKKDYTTADLRKKLLEGGYPENIAEEALAYVASFHYTDDVRYAVNYMTFHQEDKSRKRIAWDLAAKGISREVLEKAFSQWEQECGGQDEAEMIGRLLQKRKFDPETATPAQRQKEYAFLMRKGFAADRIQKAVFGHSDIWMN